jgi:hypothetical protein
MDTIRFKRQSADGTLQYQIEYTLRGRSAQYRMRRGMYGGTFTKWFQSNKIDELLYNCGFNTVKPITLLEDFFVESHFGRGVIKLTTPMAQKISQGAIGMNAVGRHVYSRLKQVDSRAWTLPSSVIENSTHFAYIQKIIKSNL